MTIFSELLGERLLQHNVDGSDQIISYISTNELEGKTIGLYFSGHWCGPSRAYTQKLAEIYKSIYENVKDNFEIVFISSDRDQSSFDSYYNGMPWKALPFSEQTRADEIKNNYDVRTLPRLDILSPTGEVLYSNCINEVSSEGAEFFRQWYCAKEKPTKTIVKAETTTTKAVTTTVFIELFGEQLLEHSADESSQTTTYMPTSKLEGKTVGLYFSGHWCRPSREFTVKLAEAYKNAYEYVEDKFEIVFVSWDNEENAYENFYKEMPWKALPFAVKTFDSSSTSANQQVITTTTTTTAFNQLLGYRLLQHDGHECAQTTNYVNTTVLEGKTVALYFSAHWCRHSREFTVKLVEAYKSVYDDVKDKFEIVFLSWDNEESVFENFYKDMPWKALPFSVVNQNVTTIMNIAATKNITTSLKTKPTEMTALTLLLGEQLLQHSAEGKFQLNTYISTSELEGKTIALYFSAQWCQPSREFTLKLVEIYKSVYKDVKDKFEIVFISYDKDDKCFDSYYKQMPWKALPFFVGGIPCLVVLSATGQILCSNGVQEVNSKDANCVLRWARAGEKTEEIVFNENQQKAGEEIYGKVNEKPVKKVDEKPVKRVNEEPVKKVAKKRPKQMNEERPVKKVVAYNDEEIPLTNRNRRLARIRSALVDFNYLESFASGPKDDCGGRQERRLIVSSQSLSFSYEILLDMHEITLKTIFSTSYILERKNQSANIKHIDELTGQLNTKLTENKIRVLKGFFHNNATSKRYRKVKCENPLHGNILELHLIATFSDECTDPNSMCKLKLLEQLKDGLSQHFNIPITVEPIDGQSTTIDVKLCNITEIAVDTKAVPIFATDSFCSLVPAKIMLFVVDGEQGTGIRDEMQTTSAIIDYDNRHNQTVTLQEETVNLLRIQLDCTQKSTTDSLNYDCSHVHHVDVWIDFNDDGNFDGAENRVDVRSPNNGELPVGTYDLKISIPAIDGRRTKSGLHRMRIQVIPSDDHISKCGQSDYSETREYTVNIIPTIQDSVMSPVIPPVIPNNPLCSVKPARIMYVHMAGQQGTVIRDETKSDILINDYQKLHHITATLYESSVTTLRIQLDCTEQSYDDSTDNGCSLDYDIDVSIDLNDDGNFDDDENRVDDRSANHDEMPQGTYDFKISIPAIDGRQIKAGPHRMRLRLIPSEIYTRRCGRSDYSEIREYIVNIIPTARFGVPAVVSPVAPSNSLCSVRPARIIFVNMVGQQGTEIRDETGTNYVISEHQNRHHATVTLYESTVNMLRINLNCAEQSRQDLHDDECNLNYSINVWIDLNDDGIFDEIENRVLHRSLMHSRGPRGAYDLEICTPAIDERYARIGQHRMRLSLMVNDDYRKQCGETDYSETREYMVNIVPKAICEVTATISPVRIRNIICSENSGKIMLVHISGELGTQLRDETTTIANIATSDNRNRHDFAVTLYADAAYQVRIQLDCSRQYDSDLLQVDCNFAHHVNVWIDLNDDGQFDESENRIYHQSSVNTETSGDMYDLQIFIPIIDDTTTKAGQHRMRLSVTRSEAYRRQCGNADHVETREYTVKIIPRKICRDNEYFDEPESDVIINLSADFPRLTHCSPGNFICSTGSSAIFSVHLSGEQNSMIHDEMTRCSSINNYEDRSRLSVTLFDNKIYRLQIQLYCVNIQDYENPHRQEPLLVGTNCNLAQNLDVWIDLNNDGSFDESTERFSYNDHHYDDNMKGYYDLSIAIPEIDEENNVGTPHKMRILLSRDEQSRQPCNSAGYGEARDYTVHILRKSYY
ncbi:unnamed protein product [Rotaria magnacalcarata]